MVDQSALKQNSKPWQTNKNGWNQHYVFSNSTAWLPVTECCKIHLFQEMATLNYKFATSKHVFFL